MDTQALNKILRDQLTNLLNSRNSDTHGSKAVPNDHERNEQKGQCVVCKKFVHKRAVYCDSGSHWVHYRCKKLTNDEVELAERDTKAEYECKQCANKNGQKYTLVESSILALRALNQATSGTSTCAIDILAESVEIISRECPICSIEMSKEEETVCDVCSIILHVSCTMQISGMVFCDGCAATLDQQEGQYESDNNDPDHVPECEIQVEENSSMVADWNLNCSQAVTEISDSSKQSSPTDLANSHSPAKCKKIDTKCSQKSVQNSNKCSSVKSKKPNSNAVSSDQCEQKDIRQLELNLKKKEEELKFKDTKLLQSKDDKLRLENHIQNLEARNEELEQKVKILRRKISSFESADQGVEQSGGNVSTKYAQASPYGEVDSLVLGVRDRVTKYVMSKVNLQLSEMEQVHHGSSNGPVWTGITQFTGHPAYYPPPANNFVPAYLQPSVMQYPANTPLQIPVPSQQGNAHYGKGVGPGQMLMEDKGRSTITQQEMPWPERQPTGVRVAQSASRPMTAVDGNSKAEPRNAHSPSQDCFIVENSQQCHTVNNHRGPDHVAYEMGQPLNSMPNLLKDVNHSGAGTDSIR